MDWLTEAVLRDFPEIWHVDQTFDLRITIRFSRIYEDAMSKSLPLPREKHFEPQKTSRDPGVLTIFTSESLSRAGVVQILAASTSKMLRPCHFLTILTSKSLSRAGVVQILATSTSKSRPRLSVFNDSDFRIALARRRGANFAASSAADPPHPPVLRSWLSQPAKPQNYGKTRHFAHFLPAKSSCLTSLLHHICAITSLGWKIFSSNSQYSRKLDS